jgi:hypothetical protein
MRNASRSISLLLSLLTVFAIPRVCSAQASEAAIAPAGRWQVTEVPNAPWLFEFTADSTFLTGTIRQSGAQNIPVSIAGGKIDGTTISFKVLTPDAGRIITFRGRFTGNEISFVRQIEVLPGGTRGGNDLFGAGASLQFVARRAR